VLGSLSDISEQAFTKSGKALENSTTATLTSSTALTNARNALKEADSFERDIVVAKKQASEAEAHLGEVVSMAKAEEVELLKLEKQVAPRVLNAEQQRSITMALRKFTGRTVDVSTYGLDGEGAAVGTQIIAVLTAAGIKSVDRRAQTIVTGGFDFGVHVRGPASEQSFVLAIADALSSIGKLQVWTNNGMVRTGVQLSGATAIGGATVIGGGGGPPGPDGPTPPGSPVTIAVGIKPVEVILAQ